MLNKVGGVVVAAALAALGYRGIAEPQGTQPKLAYINSNEIIAQAPGAAEAQQTFDKEMARWRAEVQALTDTLQQMIQQYEQQQVMLSPEKRQERQQEIQTKRLEYQQRVSDMEDVAQRRQQELVEPIYKQITAALSEIRQEGSYTMIFDAAGGGLIAADTALDITGQVIQRLKAKGGVGPGAGN